MNYQSASHPRPLNPIILGLEQSINLNTSRYYNFHLTLSLILNPTLTLSITLNPEPLNPAQVVFLLDADFVVSKSLAQEMSTPAEYSALVEVLLDKWAVVIPAFQTSSTASEATIAEQHEYAMQVIQGV